MQHVAKAATFCTEEAFCTENPSAGSSTRGELLEQRDVKAGGSVEP